MKACEAVLVFAGLESSQWFFLVQVSNVIYINTFNRAVRIAIAIVTTG
jgi:hypothetical protein